MSRGLAKLTEVPSEPIPLSVLTGFLGSGKTTLLSRVLAVPDLSDTAVLISEFGAVALDHHLLEAAVDDIVELPNGCTCCAVRQGLADSFYRLLRMRQESGRPPFRRIALETSGLADPAPTLYTLSADAFLEAALRLDRVVTTIDAVLGMATLDRYPEAAAQAAVADLLVLTKTDLASVADDLVQRLASLNPLAPVVDAADTDTDALLFGGAPRALPRPRPHAAARAHAHGIRSLSIRLRQPMSRLAFAMALGGLAQEHGEKLLRVKGLVEFSDRPGGPAAVHAVQHTLYPPRWLERWPDADRQSRLVFIVRDLEPDEILHRFADGEPVSLLSPAGVS